MRKSRWILFGLMFVLFFGLVNASESVQTLGIFKKNNPIILYQTCSDCTYNNISYILYPNMTAIFNNIPMTKSGVTFSYLLTGNYTNDYGRYIVCGFGDESTIKTTWCYDFFVNSMGRAEPSGALLTFFVVGFLFILGMLIYLFIYSAGHWVKKDFDLIDLAFDWGIYFVLVGFYIFHEQYVGNPLMSDILNVMVIVCALTHVLASGFFFFISYVWQSFQYKKARGDSE